MSNLAVNGALQPMVPQTRDMTLHDILTDYCPSWQPPGPGAGFISDGDANDAWREEADDYLRSLATGSAAVMQGDADVAYNASVALYAALADGARDICPVLAAKHAELAAASPGRFAEADSALSRGDRETAGEINASCLALRAPELNLKAFNDVLLAVSRTDSLLLPDSTGTETTVAVLALNDSLPEGLRAVLTGIAEQCPFDGGAAVYRARALLAHFDGHPTVRYDSCGFVRDTSAVRQNTPQTGARFAAAAETRDARFEVYPNPAQNVVHVAKAGGDARWKITVFDALGKTDAETEAEADVPRVAFAGGGRFSTSAIAFSPSGNCLAVASTGLLQLFDFDRCTGLLAKPVTLLQGCVPPQYDYHKTTDVVFPRTARNCTRPIMPIIITP